MTTARILTMTLLASALASCGSPAPEARTVRTTTVETPVPDATPLAEAQEPMDSIDDDDAYPDDNEIVPDEQVVETDRI